MQQFINENVWLLYGLLAFFCSFSDEIKPKTINSKQKKKNIKKDGPIDCTKGFVCLFVLIQSRLHGKHHLIPHVVL